jgi:hypothetical protein
MLLEERSPNRASQGRQLLRLCRPIKPGNLDEHRIHTISLDDSQSRRSEGGNPQLSILCSAFYTVYIQWGDESKDKSGGVHSTNCMVRYRTLNSLLSCVPIFTILGASQFPLSSHRQHFTSSLLQAQAPQRVGFESSI